MMELQATDISKRFFRKAGSANYFFAVQSCDFRLEPGCLTTLTGHSGSGKTTLLSIVSGLLSPDTGTVTAGGSDLYALDDAKRSAFRARHIAVAPQGRAVADSLSVLDNTLLTLRLSGQETAKSAANAETWLDHFGILPLRDAYPRELSGGELRRVMMIRALLSGAEFLMCDEPTADLDGRNTALMLQTLRDYAEAGHAVLLVTHEPEAPDYAHCRFQMDSGVLTAL